MKGMTPDETASYIRHHLEAAGRTADLFTDDAVTQVHQAARGKPRTVNNICLAALIATAAVGKNLIDQAAVAMTVPFGTTMTASFGTTWQDCDASTWPRFKRHREEGPGQGRGQIKPTYDSR